MIARAALLVCLACLGCHVMSSTPEAPHDGSVPTAPAVPAKAWTLGNQPVAAAVGNVEAANAAAAKVAHLTFAARHLADGDDAKAGAHLHSYLAAHPDHRNARLMYAEVLQRLGRRAEAMVQFEEVIAAEQEAEPLDVNMLLVCHQRLTGLASAADDEYALHLHRGIGLVLLAQARAALGDPDGPLPVEALLWKAAAELTTAHELRPDEARPALYLMRVWRQLGQPHQVRRWLAAAQHAAPLSALAPAERRALELEVAASPPGIRQ